MAYMKDSTGRRLDASEATMKDEAARIAAVMGTYDLTTVPAPILDLNYAERKALYGFETFTRAATENYTDALGAARTSAADTASFDHIARSGQLVSAGLKLSPGATAVMDIGGLISGLTNNFTIVVEVDRASGYANSGDFLTLSDGAGGGTHRIRFACTGNYQAYTLVTASGVAAYNIAYGAIQEWGAGGVRRIVLSVKSGAYYGSNTGFTNASSTTAATVNLSTAKILTLGDATFAGYIRRVQIIPKALTSAQVNTLAAAPAPVACWGDSLTEAGWPATLRYNRWPNSGVANKGVGGETSTQIRARMVADTDRNGWTAVIWAGRNNLSDPTTVLADIDAMVDHLTHKRFLILGVTNQNDGTEDPGSDPYNDIIAINTALEAKYPANYIDIRAMLVAASGGTNDTINASWMSDPTHLNATGYAFVATTVGAFLRARGWY